MTPIQIRPFHRSDRDQLTSLVNAHIAAVIPGGSISVQGLLSHLEGQPGEYVVDPWVRERITLVALSRDRLIAAAHLLRYADTDEVGPGYRDTAEIQWLLFWPPSSLYPETLDAADDLMDGCLTELAQWRPRELSADGTLPSPGIFGVPDEWPHVRELYTRSGFGAPARVERVLLARTADLARPTADLTPRRSVGINGTRITALAAHPEDTTEIEAGYIEVDTNLDAGARTSRFGDWADIGNLQVADTEPSRRREIAGWLLGQAADWLELAGVTQLLGYADADDAAESDLLLHNGFQHLTWVGRGYRWDPPSPRDQLGEIADREAEPHPDEGEPVVSHASEQANRRLLRARDAMDARYAEPLDIASLARIAFVSPAHFSRTFRHTFGETPHRYLQRRRVERATFLLRETDHSVTDVCLEVGFGSLGTFSRTFRDIIGVSPTAYRLRARPILLPNCRVMAQTRPAGTAVSEKRGLRAAN